MGGVASRTLLTVGSGGRQRCPNTRRQCVVSCPCARDCKLLGVKFSHFSPICETPELSRGSENIVFMSPGQLDFYRSLIHFICHFVKMYLFLCFSIMAVNCQTTKRARGFCVCRMQVETALFEAPVLTESVPQYVERLNRVLVQLQVVPQDLDEHVFAVLGHPVARNLKAGWRRSQRHHQLKMDTGWNLN